MNIYVCMCVSDGYNGDGWCVLYVQNQKSAQRKHRQHCGIAKWKVLQRMQYV